MKRYDALKIIIPQIPAQDVALFATGLISREAASILDRAGHFYVIGSMGLISSLGLGLAISMRRNVWVIDGDGSALMDLGSMANIVAARPHNFIHIILDNEQYQSTGGQPTVSSVLDLAQIAKAAGYRWANTEYGDITSSTIKDLIGKNKPLCLVVKVESGMKEVPRINIEPDKMSSRISAFISEIEGYPNGSDYIGSWRGSQT